MQEQNQKKILHTQKKQTKALKKRNKNIQKRRNRKYYTSTLTHRSVAIRTQNELLKERERIRLLHNWPNLTLDVEKYVKQCKVCQRNKATRKVKLPLILTDRPTKSFEKCVLDIVGPLPMSSNGNKYLLIFQDTFLLLFLQDEFYYYFGSLKNMVYYLFLIF